MAHDTNEIFSKRIDAGNRTYFFDVKISSEGTKYLKINEARRAEGDTYTHNRVMVFEGNIEKFMEALNAAVSVMTNDNDPDSKSG